MQLVLVLAVSLVFGGTQVPLHVRSAQTAAVCTGDYAWADNSKNDSPCLLAAKVNGACHGGSKYLHVTLTSPSILTIVAFVQTGMFRR